MFAVIKTGGKQYKVQVGSVLKVEKLAAEVNSDVEIKEVLLVGEGDNVTVGTPFVGTASVVATVKEHGKGDKKINFKYNQRCLETTKVWITSGSSTLRVISQTFILSVDSPLLVI